MSGREDGLLFIEIEHDDLDVTDAAHCDGCYEFDAVPARVEVTDTAHCDGCYE